jgi:glycine cleavage system H protein
MSYPTNLRYQKTHEYVRIEGNKAYVGITVFAQESLGDVVFVELPEVGAEFKSGEVFCTVESVKAVSDCYTPVSGEVVEVNETLNDQPELINEDPHGEGWICAIEMTDPSEIEALLDAAAYEKHVEEEGGH